MEPLKTDEKVTNPKGRVRDMDDHMILGCSGFVVASFVTYFIAIWPFFVFMDIHVLGTMAATLAVGFLPSLIQGCLSSWKFGIPGAAGFIGGMAAAVVFLNLRITQAFLEWEGRRSPEPEYPKWLGWFLPVMLIAFSILLAAAILFLASSRANTASKSEDLKRHAQ